MPYPNRSKATATTNTGETPTVVVGENPAIKAPGATTAQLTSIVKDRGTKLEGKRRNLAEYYKNEPKVLVSGAPSYAPHFGNNMPIQINGILVHVPLDGMQYSIPQTFAAEFYDRLSKIDNQQKMAKQMSNIQQNFESYPGEKGLITRV